MRLENKVDLSESIWERMGRGLGIRIGDGSGVCIYIYYFIIFSYNFLKYFLRFILFQKKTKFFIHAYDEKLIKKKRRDMNI